MWTLLVSWGTSIRLRHALAPATLICALWLGPQFNLRSTLAAYGFSLSDLAGRSQRTAEVCLTGEAEIRIGTSCQSFAVVAGPGRSNF